MPQPRPQLGILNYLLSLVGLPAQLWVFHPATVIPSLVLVETWQWTPLVMLIVLGGLAAQPVEPLESAMIDGATGWQTFRYITFPLTRTALLAGGLLSFGLSFDEVIVTTFTAGTQETIPIWILNNLRLPNQRPTVNGRARRRQR